MGSAASISLTVATLPANASDVESHREALAEVTRMRMLLRTHATPRAPVPDSMMLASAVSVAIEVGVCPHSLEDQWNTVKSRRHRSGKDAQHACQVLVVDSTLRAAKKAARAADGAAFDSYQAAVEALDAACGSEAAAEALDAVPAFARRAARAHVHRVRVVRDAVRAAENAARAADGAAFDSHEAAAEALDAVPAFARRVAARAAAASEAAAVAALHAAETIAPERAELTKGFALCAARCAVAAASVCALAADEAVTWMRTLAAREVEATVAAAAIVAESMRGDAGDEASDDANDANAELVAIAAATPDEPVQAAASVSATAPVADLIRACALGDTLAVATLLAAPRRADSGRFSGRLSPTIGQEQRRAPGAIAAGKTIAPLCAAARGGHRDVVALLLTLVQPSPGVVGMNPLHEACRQGHFDVAEMLLSSGAAPDFAATAYGVAPLHIAAARNDVPLAALLLRHGARVDARAESNGATPLLIAAGRGFDKVVAVLLAHGGAATMGVGVNSAARETPLFLAAAFGHATTVRALLRAGANAAFATRDRSATPLYAAAARGHSVVVDVFLGEHPVCDELEVKTTPRGATPLWACAARNDAVTMERLIGNGANINCIADGPKGDGSTPLYAAASRGHLAAAKMLVAQSATLEIKARVPLVVEHAPASAARGGDGWRAARAKKRGARLHATAPLASLTPLEAARSAGHDAIVSLLERAMFRQKHPLAPDSGSFLVWLSSSLLLDLNGKSAPPLAAGHLAFSDFWHASLDGSVAMA